VRKMQGGSGKMVVSCHATTPCDDLRGDTIEKRCTFRGVNGEGTEGRGDKFNAEDLLLPE